MTHLTYPKYSNRSGWNAMLPERKPNASLQGDIAVDYAIIGAGFTGLAIARRLHELDPQAHIAIFEATTIGEGASGRNSGFTGATVLPRNASLEMADKARIQSDYFSRSFKWLQETIADNNIDCDMKKTGSIRGAATELGEASVRSVMKVAEKNNVPCIALNREDIEQRIGSSYYRFGIYLEDTWLLQPASLIRGLADHLPDNIQLYENTPVTSIKRDKNWVLTTPKGVVRSTKLALANNGFIKKLGYLKSRMATIYTYAAVTEEVTDAYLPHLGQDESWGLLPCHRLGTTLRRIGKKRLMVRSLYAHENELKNSYAFEKLRDRFVRRWPALNSVKFEYMWGGTTALTMNGAPWWGQLSEDLYASGGCNGSGIAKGTMLGRHLAEMMLNHGDQRELQQIMGTASWIAPEPFRSIGFNAVSFLESRKAGLEM